MSLPDFVDAAIQSASNYRQWIIDYNKLHPDAPKGYAEDAVTGVSHSSVPNCLELSVRRKIRDCSMVQIKADGIIYKTAEIEPIFFSEETYKLRVKMRSVKFSLLLDAADIFVISDLTFLIEKTEKWYQMYGELMSIPTIPAKGEVDSPPSVNLSPEQISAVSLAMSESFSYIWGAPGTGKTRAVLAACLYHCLNNKKRTLLVAPTNNALDQSLIGVLDVLSQAGIPLNQVIRFGSPTPTILKKYPQICVAEVNNELAKKEERKSLVKRALVLRFKLSALDGFLGEVCSQFDDIMSMQEMAERLSRLKSEYDVQSKVLDDERHKKAEYEKTIELYKSKIEKFNNSIFRIFNRQKIQNMQALMDKTAALHKQVCKSIDTNTGVLREINSEIAAFGVTETAESISEIIKYIKSKDFLSSAEIRRSDFTPGKIAQTREKIDSIVNREIQKYSSLLSDELRSVSLQDLLAEFSKLDAEVKELSEGESNTQFENCFLYAATVDTCISTLAPDTHNFSHIFMDEAGYCSLAKGAILLGYGAPLTLLGDHMQLPPICEVNERELSDYRSGKLKYVSFWAQSALHMEECFGLSPENIPSKYFSGSDPDFLALKKIALSKTYRFGFALTSILASEVYTPDFTGNENVTTEIFFVDSAPSGSKGASRVSMQEVSNIVKIVEKLTLQGSDYVVLTPYRAQLFELSKRLPRLKADERIMTIHASQGREWDAVILSVVDNSHNSPWFMDSTNRKSRGKQIINTAISRARRRLIIVCDADFWYARRSKQLIGKLVDNAMPLKL